MGKIALMQILEKRGLPFGKLLTYPITVRHYEEFRDAADVLLIMQRKLPVELQQMSYLRMLCALGSADNSTLPKLSTLLSLATHLDEEQIRIGADGNTLTLFFTDGYGSIIESVPEIRFAALRRRIAEQNNLKLPNEQANLEILQSEQDIREMNSLDLSVDFESLFFSVATAAGLSSAELMDMTIYEFDYRVKAIERNLNYQIYKQAEMSGMVTFKGGIPYPSWCFDKREDGLHGTIPLAQFTKQIGNAVEDRTN